MIGIRSISGGNLLAFCFTCCISLSLLFTKLYTYYRAIEHAPVQASLIFYNNTEPMKLWSSDFHISPIADIKYLLADYRVTIIDKSLSAHCHLSNTCERDLKVITKQNGISLNPCPNQLRRDFYNAYRTDKEFLSVDGVLCNHAASMCELFMPFGKPLVVIASTRYEIGRHDFSSWQRWNDNLRRIAADPRNVVAANNQYDQEYLKYFTGIDNVMLLPNVCGYVNTRYKPNRPQVLVAPARGVSNAVYSMLKRSLRAFNRNRQSRGRDSDGDQSLRGAEADGTLPPPPLVLSPIRDLYPVHFEYSDIAAHPAVVLLPYQVSFMSLFEFYRMEVPLFAPAPALLVEWHLAHGMLSERTWGRVFGQPADHSVLTRHPNSTSRMRHDPNNEFSREAVLEWVQLADFYAWPHITTFNSFEHLFALLVAPAATDSRNFENSQAAVLNVEFLDSVSRRMHEFNLEEEARIRGQWTDILMALRQHSSAQVPGGGELLAEDINDALRSEYGYSLSSSDCKEIVL